MLALLWPLRGLFESCLGGGSRRLYTVMLRIDNQYKLQIDGYQE